MMDFIDVWEPEFEDENESDGPIQIKSFNRSFYALRGNSHVGTDVKIAALTAAPSTVCVRIYSGGEEIRWGSGFIIGHDSTANSTTIMTSASLLRIDATQNTVLDNLKVVVVLFNGEKCNGEIDALDFHYNLAAIKIQVDQALEIARLRHVSVDPLKNFTMQPDLFTLFPESSVIALGRYHDEDNDIMVAPGKFSIGQCGFDCKELLRSTCKITKCGIGGPLINCNAEVIGVNFFALEFTPFLPINIISKWWEHFKKSGDFCRPWLGLKLSSIFTIEVWVLEKIIQKFPNIKRGILVDEVSPISPAMSAGVLRKDIIIGCDGKEVHSSLQFFDIIWEKVGKLVNLVLIRTDGSCRSLSVMVADIDPDQFYSWPIPGRHRSSCAVDDYNF